uniref:Uncharacterized protein n=1 Tax=Megaselia scalaris TaxID=36166 RepID=T1GLZ4_MEGSC
MKTILKLKGDLARTLFQQTFVITGVRIRKTGKTVFLEVQQGKLLSLGDIDGSTISWKKSTGISNKYISVNHRTKVHINKVQESGGNYVLTQVNFASSNNELFVEMGLTKFNYSSGELLKERRTLSTRSNNFSTKDAAQSSVPYLEIGDVSIIEGSPLTGIGLHYKQSRGFGGFIGLSVRLYDHNKNIDDLIN